MKKWFTVLYSESVFRNLRFFCVLLSVTLGFGFAIAQQTAYSCDFEDEYENSLWNLNVGNRGEKCANRWYIGKPGKNNGKMGLFVSNDVGISNNYTNQGVSVVAYRTLQIPDGDYELSFEWQANGMDSLDGLYVCWMPDSVKTNSVDLSNLQNWVGRYAVRFDGKTRLYQKTWNIGSGIITSDGTPYKLVFVWNNGVVGTYPPAACVDNIVILETGGGCDKPYGLNVRPSGNIVRLQWSGDADKYDVKCYSAEADKWVYHQVSDTFVDIAGLTEGLCDYYVRSVCGDYFSAWVSYSEFLYFSAVRCVDYLTLTSENCFYGTVDNPKLTQGVVNEGYQSKFSRHTLHYSKTERDPRTDNRLKTVPDGESASVRLGNWCTGMEAECVEFKYNVDIAVSAVLELKYAVVLEDPGHDDVQQPRFTLQVLRGNRPLDEKGCAEADFVAGYTTDGWNKTGNAVWHDWTTVGINLQPYDGETLTIRLTTYDCTLGGHYGYAYFTLGCSDGQLKGVSCGDTPQNRFEGPDGFRYRWYLSDDPDNILCREQVFTVGAEDTLIYNLDVVHPIKEDCYYTLEASALPRYPMAEATYTIERGDCRNIVKFSNFSAVCRINHVSGNVVRTLEECGSVRWNFGDGTVSSDFEPQHVYPQEGGSYTVTLLAGISDNMCVDTAEFVIELPELGTVYDTLRADACLGSVYSFNGKNCFATGVYNDTVLSAYMCDSIVTLYLTMHDRYDIRINESVCSDDVYYFGDRLITESGIYKEIFKSVYGCDSIVTLDIQVNEALYCDVVSEVAVCIGDEMIDIPYTIYSGVLCDFDVTFAESDATDMNHTGLVAEDGFLRIPMSDDILPGLYHASIGFGDQSCGHENVEVAVHVYYPSEVIAQRWNDVLAVHNQKYNGGYDFIAYQWYKDGLPLEGATAANYYAESGLDTAAQYSVLLTRKDDGVSEFVCWQTPRYFENLDDVWVRIYQKESRIKVSSTREAEVRVWNSTGVMVDRFRLTEGIHVLDHSFGNGVYLLEFISYDNSRRIERIVVV